MWHSQPPHSYQPRKAVEELIDQVFGEQIYQSTVDFYIAQHEQSTVSGKLGDGVPLEPAKESGTGVVRDPELAALDEVIAQINDLFSVITRIPACGTSSLTSKDRLEESETLQQQVQNNSLPQFSASPDLQNQFVSAVIGAMDSHTDLSTQILNNSELSQKLLAELVPLVYKGLKAAG
jgi:type I restriction enzyme R subunit